MHQQFIQEMPKRMPAAKKSLLVHSEIWQVENNGAFARRENTKTAHAQRADHATFVVNTFVSLVLLQQTHQQFIQEMPMRMLAANKSLVFHAEVWRVESDGAFASRENTKTAQAQRADHAIFVVNLFFVGGAWTIVPTTYSRDAGALAGCDEINGFHSEMRHVESNGAFASQENT